MYLFMTDLWLWPPRRKPVFLKIFFELCKIFNIILLNTDGALRIVYFNLFQVIRLHFTMNIEFKDSLPPFLL